MFTNPFCFLVQVCAHMPTKRFHSDNRFLVLLPCPLIIANVLSDVCSFLMNLLLCGDVESNPGPTYEEMLLQLISIDDLENRSRRNNLLVYGLEEKDKETPVSLQNMVQKELFEEKLKVEINSVERCHRLGKKNEGCPVIMKFQDYRDKVTVLQACSKLKGTNFSVTEDFSSRIREIRKKLWQSLSEEKANGAKVKLVFDKLFVDGAMFGRNEEKDERYRITKKKE
ncbi:uncharacterized protein LOC119456665 [Dermacentor silvarum]|uniref:uncharacterized protein LOC119456665 n=1 Tax=Dermacentor silvarum TaxID=543639 RepID=UPI00189C2438|nr:uncharacterized protein LOC119456665 [Dermacentor silvarum]